MREPEVLKGAQLFGGWGASITWKAAQRLEGAFRVKRCLKSWKGSGDSTHIVRIGYQGALQSVGGASVPGLHWVPQKLERTQKTGGPLYAFMYWRALQYRSACRLVCQEIVSNIKRVPQRLEGATELGGWLGI